MSLFEAVVMVMLGYELGTNWALTKKVLEHIRNK